MKPKDQLKATYFEQAHVSYYIIKRKTIVAKLSIEVEHYALQNVKVIEPTWLKIMLLKLGFQPKKPMN